MKKIISLMVLLMTFTVNGFADTWTVAGSSAALNGTDNWSATNTDNDMTSGDGTNYTLTISNCTLETETDYEFKVAKNHSWEESYPIGYNKKFTVAETAIYTVTYTFNADTKEVGISTTKTGEAGVVVHDYTVAGSQQLFGTNWDPTDTDNDMTETSTGIFTWSKSDVMLDGSAILFKVCVDHAWGTTYPTSDWIINSSSVAAYANGEGIYDVTITFMKSTKNIDVSMTFKSSASSTYNVVGDEALTGYNWDKNKNEMVFNGETGLYEWTANNIIVSSTAQPEFKVVKNGITYYPNGDNWQINLAAISAEVAGKYNIKITFNASTNAIAVTSTKKTAEEVVIGTSGWATTVTNSPLDFSATGIEVYTATLSGTTVNLAKVDDVQAETGLVLKGAEGNHYIPLAESSSTVRGDLMFSSTVSYKTWGNHSFYGLAIRSGNAKFTKISHNNDVYIPARKAFLLVEDGGTGAQELNVTFEDEAGDVTGIQTLNAERNTLYGETYNLAGQKVNKSYKGLVISNGRKVIVK